ncbi:MAG: VWA domain-containing protein [Gammaproteobacteria bacterium]|nr:VWA domain-containing protein [Gammaproteobacteria bacterium]
MAEEKQVITFQPPVLENNDLSLQWWANGLAGQTVTKAELLIDGTPATTQTSLEPARGDAACYMLMVDSSKSMKAFFKDSSVKQLLTSLIERKPETHYLGIALFAENWQLLSNPTQDKAALKATLPQIEPAGDRTELLRFTLSALESLQTCPSTSYRKVLVILTDGDAEDRAYTPESIMQTARDKKIGVYGFGFKESTALQFPRRMAEETGGTFVEPAAHMGQKRDTAVDDFYVGSNSGGDLKATLPELKAGQQVQLRLTLSDGQNLTQTVPLSLEPEAALPGWKQEIIVILPWLTPKQVDYLLWGLGSVDIWYR